MSVIYSTQRPESMLKKKSNSTCYHAVRESVVMKESLTGHVSSENNPAGIATNGMRWYLESILLCHQRGNALSDKNAMHEGSYADDGKTRDPVSRS